MLHCHPARSPKQAAVEGGEPGVSASLLQALEGGEEPSSLSPGPEAAGAGAGPTAQPEQPTGVVLPVAVGPADQRSASAAAESPAVSASMAAEQEAPEAGAAELASAAAEERAGAEARGKAAAAGQAQEAPLPPADELAAQPGAELGLAAAGAAPAVPAEPPAEAAEVAQPAELAQPEGLDAPAQFLEERQVAREAAGGALGAESPRRAPPAGPGRLQFKVGGWCRAGAGVEW